MVLFLQQQSLKRHMTSIFFVIICSSFPGSRTKRVGKREITQLQHFACEKVAVTPQWKKKGNSDDLK